MSAGYAIWAGLGIAIITAIGVVVFKERLSAMKLLLLALIVGTEEAVTRAIRASRGGTVINTADSERLNATFQAHQAPLALRA